MPEVHEKEVDFYTYCRKCKHKDLSEIEKPCDECLSEPVNYGSKKPVCFKEDDNDESKK